MHELLAENSHLIQKFVKTENEITMEKLVLQKNSIPYSFYAFLAGFVKATCLTTKSSITELVQVVFNELISNHEFYI